MEKTPRAGWLGARVSRDCPKREYPLMDNYLALPWLATALIFLAMTSGSPM